jgi:hypothetical protein
MGTVKKVKGRRTLTRRKNGKIKLKKSVRSVILNKEARELIKAGLSNDLYDERGKVKKYFLATNIVTPPQAKSAFHPKKIRKTQGK